MFTQSERTASLVRFLREFPKGAEVTYVEMLKHVGGNQRFNSGSTSYVRRILEREHNQVWVAQRPDVGLRRLTDAEIADRLPTWHLNGARRKLRRGGQQAEVVDIDALDIDARARFAVDSLQRELAAQSLSRAARNKLVKISRGSSQDLPAFTAVEWAFSLSRKPRRTQGE
jgi:hypothetical protein